MAKKQKKTAKKVPKKRARKPAKRAKKVARKKAPKKRKVAKKAAKKIGGAELYTAALRGPIGCCIIYRPGSTQRYPGITRKRCQQIANEGSGDFDWVEGDCPRNRLGD